MADAARSAGQICCRVLMARVLQVEPATVVRHGYAHRAQAVDPQLAGQDFDLEESARTSGETDLLVSELVVELYGGLH